MIRSSAHTLRWTNHTKREALLRLIDEYRRVAQLIVDDLCEVPFWVRQRKLNQIGFYWNQNGLFSDGHEPIVCGTQ